MTLVLLVMTAGFVGLLPPNHFFVALRNDRWIPFLVITCNCTNMCLYFI